jgi:hypothetical protein
MPDENEQAVPEQDADLSTMWVCGLPIKVKVTGVGVVTPPPVAPESTKENN